MAFLNENEWILLNEIAYNISFIYTVEEMQKEILTRWLPFLISFDGAIFSRLQWDSDGPDLPRDTAHLGGGEHAVRPVPLDHVRF